MPTFLAAACRAALVDGGTPSEQWRRQRALLEVTVRCYVAVLASEPTRPFDPEPLERATMGTWLEAAVALARPGNHHPATAAVARTLRDPDGRATNAERALRELLQERNHEAHDRVGTSHHEVRAFLERHKQDFACVLEALEAFRELRACILLGLDTNRRGEECALWLLRGFDPEPLGRLPYIPGEIWDTPFLVGDQGEVLPLAPWVVSNGMQRPSLLVFDHWRSNAPKYYDVSLRGGTDWVGQPSSDARRLTEFVPQYRRSFPAMPVVADRAHDDRPPAPPDIQGYDIRECLGRGASGTVWSAVSGGQRCALKVLHPQLVGDAVQRSRLRREHKILEQLRDEPGICTVHALVDSNAGPTLVMDLLDGQTLDQRVERARMDEVEALELGAQVLRTLRIAHGRKLVHRDLKPSNIMLVDGAPVLIDFGLGGGEGFGRLTQTSTRLGTPHFAAPELLHSTQQADHRVDLFSLGKILAFCTTGETDQDRQRGQLSGGLLALYDKATSKASADRHGDAAEMLAAITRLLDEGLDGPPLAPGAILSETYRVGDELGEVEGEGIWVFRGTYIQKDRAVAIVVARKDRQERLDAVVDGLSGSVRAKLGGPTVFGKGSPRCWCVVDGPEPEKAAGELFAKKTATDFTDWWPAALVAAPVVLGVALAALGGGKAKKQKAAHAGKPSLKIPAYLRGLPTSPKTTRELAQATHRVGLILAAQSRARGEIRLDDAGWYTLQGTLFAALQAGLAGTLGSRVQKACAPGRPEVLQALAAAAKKNVPLPRALRPAKQAYLQLLRNAVALAAETPAEGLGPYVRSSPLGWQLRVRRGHKAAYVSI
ncbi:MAG: serine/threonine protein kinase [Proteobacteria bacterium]|nr:serine/threonine protein kinase [Pseudomonadota bacterium]